MPRTALRRTLTTLAVLAGSTGLAACGGDEEEPTQVLTVPAQEAPAPVSGASTDDDAPARPATADDDDRDDRDDDRSDDDRDEQSDDRDDRDDRDDD